MGEGWGGSTPKPAARARTAAAAIGAALALALTGCSTSGLNTTHAIAERAETDAEVMFQVTDAALKSAMMAGKITPKQAMDMKAAAWLDLSVIREAYNAGRAIDDVMISALKADRDKAKGL